MAYRLSFEMDVADSLRECIRGELASAASLLGDEFDADPVEAIHEARKSLKKARALLRLVRPGLGKHVYRRENRALRDAGRLVSGARDADVLVETVAGLAERYAGRLPEADFDGLAEHLRAAAAESRAAGAAGAGRAEAIDLLDGVANRVEDWPLADCDWATVAAGMEVAYGRGRAAFAAADGEPTVERLHDWRKRVKDIWYHQRLISPSWPEVLDALAEEAHRLSEILGDDHDLAVLAELLEGDSRPPVPADPTGLLELVAERRAELLECARHRGRLIYAERPAAFARRTRHYLEEGREAAAATAEEVATEPEDEAAAAAEHGEETAADAAEDPCGYEIERKFLVAEVPGELDRFPAEAIEQGYIVIEGSAEVRVRRRGGRTLLTVKSGAGGVRVEEEFEIDERRFASLWPLSDGRRVAKTRYRLPEDGDLTIELDVYAGALDGLVLAEVEFDSEAASEAYEPPDWFGPEVTEDLRYANRALAVDGVPATGADAGAPRPA